MGAARRQTSEPPNRTLGCGVCQALVPRQSRMVDFDVRADAAVQRPIKVSVRIGTMELLARNLRDFRRVPGLRVEDWTG